MPVAHSWVYAASAGVGVVSGLMIGAVGVGGVILVPVLANLPGGGAVAVKVAVATCMFSYIFAGAAGAGAYARRGSIAWRPTLWLFLGATPAAFAGAFTLRYLSGKAVQLVLYIFVLLSSFVSLARTMRAGRAGRAAGGGGGDDDDAANGDADGDADGGDGMADQVREINEICARTEAALRQPFSLDGGPKASAGAGGAIGPGAVVVQMPAAAGGAAAAAGTDGDYLALTNGRQHDGDDGRRAEEGQGAASPQPPRKQPSREGQAAAADPAALGSRTTRVIVGVVTGFGSAFTGTSGPVIFLPIALGLCGWDVLASLGSAQAVQLPIALAATVANVALADSDGTSGGGDAGGGGASAAGTAAQIDFALGGVLAASLSPAVLLGAAVAHRAPKRTLSLAVNAVLIISAVALVAKVLVAGLK